MDCRKVREVVFLYTDNELEESIVISFREHLELCPKCARRIAVTQHLMTLFRKRCARTVAPEGLRRRILTSLPHRRQR